MECVAMDRVAMTREVDTADQPNMIAHARPLSLCVINFNGQHILRATLEALLQGCMAGDELLLVDSASTDASMSVVEQSFPDIRIIRLPVNGGPAAARNGGFAAASHSRILFVDNDIRIHPHCPALLSRALDERPDACFVVPRVLYAGDPRTIQFEGADTHFTGLMSLSHADRPAAGCDPSLHRRGSLVTACFLVDRDRWRGGSLFDESFVFNLEDHDLGVRARVFGHEILSLGTALAYHGEGTEGLSHRPGGVYSKRRVYYLIRNRWQILIKSYAVRSLFLLLPALLIYEIFQFVGVVRKGWLGSWLKAAGWILLHSPACLTKRRGIQRRRRVNDCDILVGGPLPFTQDLARTGIDRLACGLLNRVLAGYWNFVGRLL